MDSPLPYGWTAQTDQLSGKTYFIETSSGTVTWEDPRLVFPDLEQDSTKSTTMPIPIPGHGYSDENPRIVMPSPSDCIAYASQSSMSLENPGVFENSSNASAQPSQSAYPPMNSNNPFNTPRINEPPYEATSQSSQRYSSQKVTEPQGTASSYLDLVGNTNQMDLNPAAGSRYLGTGSGSVPSTTYGSLPNQSNYYLPPPTMQPTTNLSTSAPSKSNMTSIAGGGLGGLAIGLAAGELLGMGRGRHHHYGRYGYSGFYGPFGHPHHHHHHHHHGFF
ncbi:hypothetical protein K493DRAFT_36757 [Basidiobolus meristosporus CBS 931.73]|uniref:WW domain-containing protein n=1 Tax=Basidiobolus meristosporus CBS 931.73 TaxID=1314790 RepID=A0A1Y1Y6L3_9FUNG|nr:hypothetical protein K493DRAFT_36757 [Basidiobolus meristosporus CBS 931.73]|eukprot:ORX93356.1 hypothetical protein K493DRAFT_36757 [Basidiobolus meristosporus CBS 931.73]